jgi:hypothetical protein
MKSVSKKIYDYNYKTYCIGSGIEKDSPNYFLYGFLRRATSIYNHYKEYIEKE